MTTTDRFQEAQERVKNLRRAPGTKDLLALYSLYKQATVGDVSGDRPSILDPKGRAKHDAWSSRRGMAAERAREEYAALVERLIAADRG